MKRRLPAPAVEEARNGNGGNGRPEGEDPDPAEGFPEWSKTLLLLLDYAMIEGVRRRLDLFAHLLDMARLELHSQIMQRIEAAGTGASSKENRSGKGRATS